ncbi:hypothetical protein EYZ11_013102 [Aspergillus tanneri]|uniref:Uncharacterized protein n=1 Tax=Aspergillus tanneri TaxID=1220188 RepID=A0A4S3IYL2_9EURO|nr:uncharacterized protein ATNIH1004_011717 [Aspergillus tanneri]KAA8641581.1 hypothetical protein ATNIH1004_011717 [Aspergillus tanneri]THC87453.1 hypothetical protein EYZ11_013102 [Aspergillus tanneri]
MASSLKASDELVHVVRASHILSLLNPYIITAPDEPLQPNQEVNDDDKADFDDDSDQDPTSIDAEPWTTNNEVLRRKFLDCICELLAHTKSRDVIWREEDLPSTNLSLYLFCFSLPGPRSNPA